MLKQILISIKPIYAEKIFSGEKRFEYRRRLCKYDIDKIYIYASSPVQLVIGEAQVHGKLSMTPEQLWDATKDFSGTEYKYYMKYFEGCDIACAYSLGSVRRYECPVSLKELGIDFYPQSHIYIDGPLNIK